MCATNYLGGSPRWCFRLLINCFSTVSAMTRVANVSLLRRAPGEAMLRTLDESP